MLLAIAVKIYTSDLTESFYQRLLVGGEMLRGKEKRTIDGCRSVRGVGKRGEGNRWGSGMRIDGNIRTNHRPRLAPMREERLKWEKQIKTSVPAGFRRQETKINDIISCRTDRSLPWKRNQVKKSTTRQVISCRRSVTLSDNETGPNPHPHHGMMK